MLTIYSEQAHLLISVLPTVAKESCFALKGGTAINLFVRNMPRLSVDIDLSYLPVEDRDTSLKNIDTALNNIESNIPKAIPGSINELPRSRADEVSIKELFLFIRSKLRGIIPIEINKSVTIQVILADLNF